MSVEFNIGAEHKFFVGEDKVLSFTIFGADGVTPADCALWALELPVRKTDHSSSFVVPLKTKANGKLMVTGAYNVDPQVNTQRVVAFFESEDTTGVKAGTYRWSLKRTDDGEEAILTYGNFTLLEATAH